MLMLPSLLLAVSIAHPAPPPLFERVVLVGASITQGYGLRAEIGGLAKLSDYVRHAQLEPGQVKSYGDVRMFIDPVQSGAKQLAKAEREDATLLIGAEFLFWFAYGRGMTEKARLRRFEEGLGQLAELKMPILVGDVPDMSPALKGVSELTGGPFLSPNMIPSAQTRAAMNARLSAWAAERENITILPLAALLHDLHAGAALKIGDRVLIEKPDPARLLQSDLLHTTSRGSALMALATLYSLSESREDVSPELFAADVETLDASLRKEVDEERRAREERRKKRRDGKGNDERQPSRKAA